MPSMIERFNRHGFTVIELMVTMMIAIILASGAYISMTGLIPRLRLQGTGQMVEQILARAQQEAQTRQTRIGVQFIGSSKKTRAEIFVDDGATNFARDTSEGAIASAQFRTGVEVVDAPCNPFRLTTACGSDKCRLLFFNGGGEAIDTSDNLTDYEIFIGSSR